MALRDIAATSAASARINPSVPPTTKPKRRLAVVPPLTQLSVRSITHQDRDSKSFVTICATIATAGLLTMFGLNMALTEGAFTVRSLKLEVIEMKELRQAALTEVAYVSSPERLAQSATRLGMVPSGKPRFLQIESE
jgi:hypothetical protein